MKVSKKLTDAYLLQKVITDKSVIKIIDYYFKSESHKKENIDATLIQFRMRFYELIGQEKSMKYLYEKAINSIE